MKILVTGSSGFIGSTLVLRLLARGDAVVGIDNHNNNYVRSIDLTNQIDFQNLIDDKCIDKNLLTLSEQLDF
jgi:nucleoside-diphosphate-sugar epimerase